MASIDRRAMLKDILAGAVVAAAGVAAVGVIIRPTAAEAIPLAVQEADHIRGHDIFEKAQVVVVNPRRRRRRRVCWWRRGRRVCGWRW
jgi:hypothetical protein